jgi:hypothetical protein
MAPFAQKRIPAHLNPEKSAAHASPGSARSRGQPTLYKPEYCDLVVDKMADGISLTAFAGSIRVAKETVYAWMSDHSEFSDAVARGRAARVLKLELKLLSARYGAQSSASIFALRNADPQEWRDVRSVQHDHNVTLQTMSDEQLLAIAQGRGHDRMIDVTPAKPKR